MCDCNSGEALFSKCRRRNIVDQKYVITSLVELGQEMPNAHMAIQITLPRIDDEAVNLYPICHIFLLIR
jgi:hypothetical protein